MALAEEDAGREAVRHPLFAKVAQCREYIGLVPHEATRLSRAHIILVERGDMIANRQLRKVGGVLILLGGLLYAGVFLEVTVGFPLDPKTSYLLSSQPEINSFRHSLDCSMR